MELLSKIDQLTTPTTTFAKNVYASTSAVILGACALNSWPGAIAAAAFAPFITSKEAPNKRLLAAVVLTSVNWGMEHFLPGQTTFSYCTGVLPLLFLGPKVIRDTILTTTVALASSLALQYHLDKAYLAISAGSELLTLTALWQQDESKMQMLFGALAVSAIATTYLSYPSTLTYYIHPTLVLASFLVSRLIKNRNIFSWSEPDGPSSSRRRRSPTTRRKVDTTERRTSTSSQSQAGPQSPVKKKGGSSSSTFNARGGPTFSPSKRAQADPFADGIPDHLKKDRIFSLFKDYATDKPICFEPYYSPYSSLFFDGKTISSNSKRLLAPSIPLPKIQALIEARKKNYRPLATILYSFVMPNEIPLLKEALNELAQHNQAGRLDRIISVMRTILTVEGESVSPPQRRHERSGLWRMDYDEDLLSFRTPPSPLSDSDDEESISAPRSDLLIDRKKWEERLSSLPPPSCLAAVSRAPRITCANGIPYELSDDVIFSLCPFILERMMPDLTLDPRDRKNINWRIKLEYQLEGKHQVIELPKFNALLRERMQFCDQKLREGMSIDQLKTTLPENRRCLIEALGELTYLCPASEERTKLSKILGYEVPQTSANSNLAPPPPVAKISFDDGIPEELQDDIIFSICSCGINIVPSLDWVLDPTDMKTVYDRKVIHRSLTIKKESPTTRKPLTPGQLIEVPEINALYAERRRFYEQKIAEGKPIAQLLTTPPEDLSCLRAALQKCSDDETCKKLRAILSADPKNWDFTNGIPPELYDDCVFSRFICPFTKAPILDFAIDPTDEKKQVCDKAALKTSINIRNISPFSGTSLTTDKLISLTKLNALVNERKREFIRLIGSGAPKEEILAQKQNPPNEKSLRDAIEEAQKLCPESAVVQDLIFLQK